MARPRKPRKRVSRFVSRRMIKIAEEIQRSYNMMRAVGATKSATNPTSMPQRAKQSAPKIGNKVQAKSMREDLVPSTKSVGKSNHSSPVSQHMNQARTLKINSRRKYSKSQEKLNKVSTSSHLNGTLKLVVPPHKVKMKQVPANSSSCIKRSCSQANRLKAMPELVRNTKNRSNLDRGATKGMMHSESGQGVCIGGTKDIHMRGESLPKPKIPGDVDLNMTKKRNQDIEINGVDDIGDHGSHSHANDDCSGGTKVKNMPKKRRKYIEANDDVDDIDDQYHPSDEDDFIVHGSRSHADNGCYGETRDKNMPKKRRKYIETNDDDDDISGQDHRSDEDDYTRLPAHHATLKDCHAKVSTLFVSKCVAQQNDFCSKPIDEPAWSGILKIGSKEYVSLAGHLSTKSCEKVWNLSKLLRRVVEVTKVCRSEVWPKRWVTSRPTNDIGIYFFPYKMRPDKYHDQLVKEVMENDLALRAAIDEAEMLIFPSSLLPEQYQKFQSKHYLWGVFKPRVVEGNHRDELRHVKNSTEAATATVVTNATTSVPTDATAVATYAGTVPTEALMMPTKAHTGPTNHGRIDSSMGAHLGRVVSFVVRKTPRVEQLIQEMEREGALIVAMQGQMLTGDGSLGRRHGDHNAASRSSA